MHAIVHCPKRGCNRLLAILPGAWEVVRTVSEGERVGEGSGILTCHIERDAAGRIRRGCGTRYEIRAIREERRAAA